MKKYFLVLLMITFLASCWQKEEVKPETASSTTQTWINQEQIVEKEEEPKDFRFISMFDISNEMYTKTGSQNLYEKIETLKNDKKIENKQKATYLESFVWDYENALKNRKELCEKENDPKFCENKNLVVASFSPVDQDWKYLENVKLTIDWGKEVKNSSRISLEPNFAHRLKYSKEGYLDFHFKANLKNTWDEISFLPKLVKADLEKEQNSIQRVYEKTENFTFKTNGNNYLTKDGKEYNWKVKLYFFDLDETNNDANAFNLDVFDEKGSLTGTSMVTFGMPYIKAYNEKGEELDLKWWFTWSWIIQNQHKAINMDLKNVPKNVYLWKTELDKYGIPPFWVLTDNWVWKESKMKILDEKWNYEFIYEK